MRTARAHTFCREDAFRSGRAYGTRGRERFVPQVFAYHKANTLRLLMMRRTRRERDRGGRERDRDRRRERESDRKRDRDRDERTDDRKRARD